MLDAEEPMDAPELPSIQQQRLLDVLDDALLQFDEEQDEAEEVVEEQHEVSAEDDETLQWEIDETAEPSFMPFGSGDLRPNRIVAPNEDPKFVGSNPLGSGDLRDPIMGPKADAKDIGSGPLQSGEFRDEDDEEVEMPDVDEQMNAPEVPSLQQQRLLDVLEDALFQFEEEQDDAEEVVEEQEEVSAE
eukprot:13315703-Ditylum_brightwellii.AAC.1